MGAASVSATFSSMSPACTAPLARHDDRFLRRHSGCRGRLDRLCLGNHERWPPGHGGMPCHHHVGRFLFGQVLPVVGTVQMRDTRDDKRGTAGGIDQVNARAWGR